MANKTFNIALGKVKYYTELPAANDALIVVLLKATGLEADATLVDHDTLSALLAAANDEADFTNYVRKTAASITNTITDGSDVFDADFADVTWTAAGGAANNSLGALIVCYDPDTTGGTDADIIPLTKHDYVITTDGSDLVAQVAATGFFRASS